MGGKALFVDGKALFVGGKAQLPKWLQADSLNGGQTIIHTARDQSPQPIWSLIAFVTTHRWGVRR